MTSPGSDQAVGMSFECHLLDVRAGEHGDDVVPVLGLVDVHRLEGGVSVLTPEDRHVGCVGELSSVYSATPVSIDRSSRRSTDDPEDAVGDRLLFDISNQPR